MYLNEVNLTLGIKKKDKTVMSTVKSDINLAQTYASQLKNACQSLTALDHQARDRQKVPNL